MTDTKQLTRRDFLKVVGTASLGLALSGCGFAPAAGSSPITTPIPGGPRVEISRARVAILYENITDGVLIGRTIGQTIDILKETHTDLIFRGFWKWMPVVDSPDNIPPELLELAPEGTSLEQVAEALRKTGHYYQELARWISAIKQEVPAILFVGAIPAQTLARIEYNPITGRTYSAEETWEMALDPQKWDIVRNGNRVTKEQFQRWWYGVHPYGETMEQYDWRKARGYFPDITHPDFQELLLSWARKQIDSGADAIWIDMLDKQAAFLIQMTGDVEHPSVAESVAAASSVVQAIRGYGQAGGKRVYVGTWAGFAHAELLGLELPYEPPAVDFVTITPSAQEIRDRQMDGARWEKAVPAIRRTYGDLPILAFIDWGFDQSPTVTFSQELGQEEQREMLRTLDGYFGGLGVNFVYPVHGGYMGRGEITTRLAWDKYRTYDALAPEFDTYPTIRELAQRKAAGGR